VASNASRWRIGYVCQYEGLSQYPGTWSGLGKPASANCEYPSKEVWVVSSDVTTSVRRLGPDSAPILEPTRGCPINPTMEAPSTRSSIVGDSGVLSDWKRATVTAAQPTLPPPPPPPPSIGVVSAPIQSAPQPPLAEPGVIDLTADSPSPVVLPSRAVAIQSNDDETISSSH
jgi:hypothetical protein